MESTDIRAGKFYLGNNKELTKGDETQGYLHVPVDHVPHLCVVEEHHKLSPWKDLNMTLF